MKVLHIVPPVMYEAVGIYPTTIPFPSRIGEVAWFEPAAKGTDVKFRLSKVGKDSWCLICENPHNPCPRARFGNAAEIGDDCSHAWLHGALPGNPGRP